MAFLKRFLHRGADGWAQARHQLMDLDPVQADNLPESLPSGALEEVQAILRQVGCLERVPGAGPGRPFAPGCLRRESRHTLRLDLDSRVEGQSQAGHLVRREYLYITRLAEDRWAWYREVTREQLARVRRGLGSQPR